nr:hypothetical protein [Spirochaetia bacterium]
ETVSEFLYWQWLAHLVSRKRPENEKKVPLGENGEDGLNWYSYVNNDPVNFIDPDGLAEIYADDIHGDPILAWPTWDIKADTSLEINRDSSEAFYNDTLNVKIGNQTLQQFDIQSEADWPGYEDDTLTEGTRTGTLYDQSGHYDNAILIDGNDTFIHPDQWTTDKYIDDPDNGPWDQPYSQNCQIMRLDDFNSLTSTLEGIGYNYNYKDTIEVTINDDKKNK